MKKFFQISFVLIVAVAFVFLSWKSSDTYKGIKCQDVGIQVDEESGIRFLNKEMIAEMLLEKQLQAALTERKAVMGEFLRLKAELARTQQRNDDLRSENRALREALHAAEHEVSNLFAYATQVGEEASS